MELRQTERITEVGGKRYRLKKVTARSACWLFAFLGGKATSTIAISGLGQCSQQEFDEIVTLVLYPIVRLDVTDGNSFEVPVLSGKGIISDESLATDAGELFALVTEAILFNLGPFLIEKPLSSQDQTISTGSQ